MTGSVLALNENPDQYDKLRRDPSLLDSFVLPKHRGGWRAKASLFQFRARLRGFASSDSVLRPASHRPASRHARHTRGDGVETVRARFAALARQTLHMFRTYDIVEEGRDLMVKRTVRDK
jgi:hypothetical protein